MPVGLNPSAPRTRCQWDYGVFNIGSGNNKNHFKERFKLVKAEDRNVLSLNVRVMDKDTAFGHAVLSRRNMLRAFGHRVAICCDMLGVVGSSLTIFKLEPTTPNKSQHIATLCPNAREMLRPTMLRYVSLACCDRLSGALSLVAFFISCHVVI